MRNYGLHLLGGLNGCTARGMHEKSFLEQFLGSLTRELDMEPMGPPHLDAYAGPHKEWNGWSGTQHIQTSHITCHVFKFGYVFLDAFSCKDFDARWAKQYIELTFQPDDSEWHIYRRGFNFPVGLLESA